MYVWMIIKLCPRRGWLLPDEADGHAEGYENSRVDDEGDDPEGADLLFVHVCVGLESCRLGYARPTYAPTCSHAREGTCGY